MKNETLEKAILIQKEIKCLKEHKKEILEKFHSINVFAQKDRTENITCHLMEMFYPIQANSFLASYHVNLSGRILELEQELEKL